jgi:hypothetical protein
MLLALRDRRRFDRTGPCQEIAQLLLALVIYNLNHEPAPFVWRIERVTLAHDHAHWL